MRYTSAGDAAIEAGHRQDDAAGFGAQAVKHFEKLGYRDLAHLHQGADARIFAATSSSGEPVAIRVQAPFAMERWRNRPTFGNFVRLKLLTIFSPHHQNLAAYRYCGRFAFKNESGGGSVLVPFLVMERIEGANLLEALNDPEFKAEGISRIAQTVSGILRGWSAFHRRGLRQGDISPTNVMLRKGSWEPVLVDLRFSIRFGRNLDRERHEFRCTLRALLGGTYSRDKDLAPLSPAAASFWSASSRDLQKWVEFCEGLAPQGRLNRASPPELLHEAERIAHQ